MFCKVYLGAICTLLEDIGFIFREDPNTDLEMSYHCYIKDTYNKIFADVDKINIVEVMFYQHHIYLDRWKLNNTGLYIVTNAKELDIYNPQSTDQITNFVKETIIIAKNT